MFVVYLRSSTPKSDKIRVTGTHQMDMCKPYNTKLARGARSLDWHMFKECLAGNPEQYMCPACIESSKNVNSINSSYIYKYSIIFSSKTRQKITQLSAVVHEIGVNTYPFM